MSTHIRTGLAAIVLGLATSLSVAHEQAGQPADQAQLKKQCEDMKNMDMSKMSAGDQKAMMKKCKELESKDKDKPKSDGKS